MNENIPGCTIRLLNQPFPPETRKPQVPAPGGWLDTSLCHAKLPLARRPSPRL